MEFMCIEIDDYSSKLGYCTLPLNTVDPVGTEHMFGDTLYVLVETRIQDNNNIMYFIKKEA